MIIFFIIQAMGPNSLIFLLCSLLCWNYSSALTLLSFPSQLLQKGNGLQRLRTRLAAVPA